MAIRSPSGLSLLDWLRGRWQARVSDSANDCDASSAELLSEFCLLTQRGGIMPGIWSLGPGSFLLLSIREVEGALEWRPQEHQSSLEGSGGTPLLVMQGVEVSAEQVTFESRSETGHARIERFRMNLARTAENQVRVQFLVRAEADQWVTIRDDLHVRLS